jgi:phage terminase large subunit
MGRTLNIETPRAMLPLLGNHRFKGAKGGRGGTKSHFFCEMLVEEMVSQHTRAACLREVQNSIKDSVKQLLEDKIEKHRVGHLFKITDREIICPSTDSLAVFRGLQNHTAASIKSLEGFNRALYEEAQTLTQRSLDLAIPTFRVPGSQNWFAWNPDLPKDPVDKMFRENAGDPDFVCVTVNFEDNPWFPDELRRDMLRDRQRDPDKYSWIWRGGYRRNSEAQVFRNWKVERFDAPPAGVKILGGGDWGFSVDPTVGLLGFVIGKTLYIWREVWALGCEIDRTPALMDKLDPTWTSERAKDPNWKSLARRIPLVMDGAWPQSVKFMQDHGYSNLTAAVKGPGSVEEGVNFLKQYDIIIHPDCMHTIDEFKLFSFKIDKKTDEITNELDEINNHCVDSARYMVEGVRRATTVSREELRI